MFGGTNDQITHKERWETYTLPYPQTLRKHTSYPSPSHAKHVEMNVESAVDESQAMVAKASFAPSPYVHFASDNKHKKLGLAALTVLIFYEVSGGPFGIEDIVRAGGPFYALMGFSLLFVWAIPEALITAELSTAMPEASGSVAWVDCAFGPFWAFQKGWLSWLSGVADNALYPILFLDCLVGLLSEDDKPSILSQDGGNPHLRFLFILTVTLGLTYLNYRGLDIVGKVAIAICLMSLLPFVLFCIFGAAKVNPARWLEQPEGGFWGVNWRLLLNTFFWNINFWVSASWPPSYTCPSLTNDSFFLSCIRTNVGECCQFFRRSGESRAQLPVGYGYRGVARLLLRVCPHFDRNGCIHGAVLRMDRWLFHQFVERNCGPLAVVLVDAGVGLDEHWHV